MTRGFLAGIPLKLECSTCVAPSQGGGPLRATDAAVDTRTFNGHTASDHYPVIATLEWI